MIFFSIVPSYFLFNKMESDGWIAALLTNYPDFSLRCRFSILVSLLHSQVFFLFWNSQFSFLFWAQILIRFHSGPKVALSDLVAPSTHTARWSHIQGGAEWKWDWNKRNKNSEIGFAWKRFLYKHFYKHYSKSYLSIWQDWQNTKLWVELLLCKANQHYE